MQPTMTLRRSIGAVRTWTTSVIRADRCPHDIPATMRLYSTDDNSRLPESNLSKPDETSTVPSPHPSASSNAKNTTLSSQESLAMRLKRTVKEPNDTTLRKVSVHKLSRKQRKTLRTNFDPTKKRVPYGLRLIDGELRFKRTARKMPGQPKTTEWISLKEDARSRTPTGGFGRKEVYMPDAVLTLLNTPRLPPNFASFLTPLWFNKLDIRDYLYHAYELPVLSVRSQLLYNRVIRGRRHLRNKLWRPRPTKRMTVQLARPFIWPKEPEDKSPWEPERFEEVRVDQIEQQERNGGELGKTLLWEVDEMKEQAEALLSGKKKWSAGEEEEEKRRGRSQTLVSGLVSENYLKRHPKLTKQKRAVAR